MSMNIKHPRREYTKIETYSPVTFGLFVLLFLGIVGAVGWSCGMGWAVAVLLFVLWSDCILRLAAVNFRGRRKKDKVMAPLVEKEFSGHMPDPVLGWSLIPDVRMTNSFAIPRKKMRLDYTVSTDVSGRRVTADSENGGKPVISIYGCSNTFGWGLDDEATYPWLVQAALPEHTVLNYGVSGYSLYQVLLSMERTLERDKPKVVVLGFSPGLEARSVSDHHYLRILSEEGAVAPSCLSVVRRNGKRTLKRFPLEAYKYLPLSGSSPLIKLVERGLNRLFYKRRGREDARRMTTEHLLLMMSNLCKKHGAVFHVQYLVANTGYRDFLHTAGFNWAPGPLDLDLCDAAGNYLYRLSPFDGHPNATANREYADTLTPILHQLMESGSYKPEPGALGTSKRDDATESAIYPVF